MNLYSASSRLLLRNAPNYSTAKKSSFKARVECIRVNPGGAIAVPMEAHSKQRGLPLRMHEPDELKYRQKGQRVPPVPLIGGNCDLWCPRRDSKDSNIIPFYISCIFSTM